MVRAHVDFSELEAQEAQDGTGDSLLTELFGQLNGTLNHVEEKIVRGLFELARRVWKRELPASQAHANAKVEQLAEECGYCARVHEGASDWLWDKTWFKKRATQVVLSPRPYATAWHARASEWAKVEGIKLVFEYEWNNNLDEILKDFMKLVFVEAKLRLFVYQYNPKVDLAKICKDIIPISNRKRFLLIGYAQYPQTFQVDSFVV